MMATQVTDETGSRYYQIGDQQYWSVTTALSIIAKQGLPFWSANLAAAAAFDLLPQVITASRTKACGNTASQCRQGRGPNAHDWRITCTTCPCRRCRACVTRELAHQHIDVRDTRADEGRRVHDVIEQWVLTGGQVIPHEDDIHPYVEAFLVFATEYGLTPDSWHFAEATLVNRKEGYAGTTDGVILFQCNTDAATELVARLHQLPTGECKERDLRADLTVDFKTKARVIADTGGRPGGELALQLAGYRQAEAVLIGQAEEPMPATIGALGVQLRLDGALPILTVVDETTYAAFLCALNLYRWFVEAGTASVSPRAFKAPAPAKAAKAAAPAAAKPATTTRARKTTPAKAAATAPARSAVLASLDRYPPPAGQAHPDSPYDDNIPF
jgi:hypothetical protein